MTRSTTLSDDEKLAALKALPRNTGGTIDYPVLTPEQLALLTEIRRGLPLTSADALNIGAMTLLQRHFVALHMINPVRRSELHTG